MEATHLFGLIPLLIFLVLSLVFWGKGLVHLLTIGYTLVLAWMAVANQWEILFFPVCAISGIIAIILFGISMLKGDWL